MKLVHVFYFRILKGRKITQYSKIGKEYLLRGEMHAIRSPPLSSEFIFKMKNQRTYLFWHAIINDSFVLIARSGFFMFNRSF